jgi:hypothetical protein
MRAERIALAVIAIAGSNVQAVRRENRHGQHGCQRFDHYTQSKALSANSYVYSAADWGLSSAAGCITRRSMSFGLCP